MFKQRWVSTVVVRVACAIVAVGTGACGTTTNGGGGGGTFDAVGGGDGGGGGGGGGTTDSGGTTIGTVEIGNLQATMLDAFCARLITCPGGLNGLSLSTKESCKAILGQVFKVDEILAAVTAGTVQYDGAKLGACLGIMTATCDMFSEDAAQPAECKAAIKGTLAAGKPCTSNDECVDGICKKPGQACPGTCATPAAKDSSCDSTGQCVAGMHCVNGKCSDAKWGGADGLCNGDSDCAATSYCGYSASGEKCTPNLAAGADCMDSGSCADGFTCASSGGKGKCVAAGKAGDPCMSKDGCATGTACIPTADGKGGACAVIVALGGKCTRTAECSGIDTWCAGPAGAKTCQILPGKGAACAADVDQTHPFACLPPAVCAGTMCGDLLSSGAACQNTGLFNPCGGGLECVDSKCGPLPGEGAACEGKCAKGLTCVFGSGGGKCEKVSCGS